MSESNINENDAATSPSKKAGGGIWNGLVSWANGGTPKKGDEDEDVKEKAAAKAEGVAPPSQVSGLPRSRIPSSSRSATPTTALAEKTSLDKALESPEGSVPLESHSLPVSRFPPVSSSPTRLGLGTATLAFDQQNIFSVPKAAEALSHEPRILATARHVPSSRDDADATDDLSLTGQPLTMEATSLKGVDAAEADLQTPVKPTSTFSLLDETLPALAIDDEPSPNSMDFLSDANTGSHAAVSSKPATLTSEFDPLIPKDWMMSFDSPAPLSKSDSFASLRTASQSAADAPSSAAPPGMASSLLDSFEPLSTPKSALKYSQRDIDLHAMQLRSEFDREFSLAQGEIQDLSKEKHALELEMHKIKETLGDWERAVKTMIQERERDRAVSLESERKLQEELGGLKRERDAAKREVDEITIKYKQLRVEHADLTEPLTQIHDVQTKELAQVKDQLEKSVGRFEALKRHAEAKLEEANVEIARVRSTYEKELLGTKSKVVRLEASTNTLTKSLEGKTRECEELIKICDALEKQLQL
ncbi:Transforming acidic coiled-coil-containing protein 2 [Kappamyces sp. JEL0680]|nr:Transforming acidic coiled-coil-containing protein 2 [Kappamyces sp. JEL0680]